ncbi:uncharacterized protein TEOVI_000267800 [Trypanosoma equiperdum]|uniref:Uncharacterized protein n=4 Tax=Trypanozoon TaxID=39700 RepID=Q580D2_TRYB2|nr:hypothetical protein, conserved [Trypanosoma brucei gambiense DAL972]XP_844254.1 hypothetical protein, conserved [Trypanosoma brucei brucei TREU927]AAX80902.1 hypothetical protein, conserved [Trypanosoma brucei]RHW72788.1 hypothetical protein DPX39_040012800 [Trypanosoma brucei equiperdum]SCU71098.1 hypothetical protein, conserved [Trypanosoma equiperdum]AAZ10695.1 hypothetical protein, conserved [Trypanosoma brucei brucei TREU927]CBH10382.1 hypothetical protein, conserved [Trypanosoma bru|eukprot:XP_011772672.1 hypothetical protein, conserved [Trypanosoma brucei gambiense DAL972]
MEQDSHPRIGLMLTEGQFEALVTRLHDKSVEHKAETLRQLDARFYPTAPPKRLPKEAIESSVVRQVDHEMNRRRAARENLEIQEERKTLSKKISSADVESSVERLYTETLARKKANMEESRKRYLYAGPDMVKKNAKEIQEYVGRLAVPKKKEFTIEEVNKVYDLV